MPEDSREDIGTAPSNSSSLLRQQHRVSAAPPSCPQKEAQCTFQEWQRMMQDSYLQVVNLNQHQSLFLLSSTFKMPSRKVMPTKCLITHFLQDSHEQLTSNRNNILPCSRQGRIHCASQGDRDQLALGALLAPWASQYIFCRQKML